jgi:hypothetical protein
MLKPIRFVSGNIINDLYFPDCPGRQIPIKTIHLQKKAIRITVSKNVTIPKVLASRFCDKGANSSLKSPLIEPLLQLSYRVSINISVIES